MSRIDDAMTRVTGKPAETPKPRFGPAVSQSTTGRRVTFRGEGRGYPNASMPANCGGRG